MDLNLGKFPWYGQLGAFLGLSVVAVAGFYYFHAVPVNAENDARRDRLASVRADVQKAQETASRLPEFEAEVEDLEERLEQLKEVLPEQKDVAELLRRIQTLATQSDLTIRGFRPQPVATRDLHAEWPIQLELEGTYHRLGEFFDEISRFSRIINIGAINIKASEPPDAVTTITVQCTATTFVLLETLADPDAPELTNTRASR
jgi:type IV pilus assembly protein PilO